MNDRNQALDTFRANLRKAVSKRTRVTDGDEVTASPRRKRSQRATDSKYVRYQLVEVDGYLDWEDATDAMPSFVRRRRGTGGVSTTGALGSLEFEKLEPSQVTDFLAARDLWLTPERGLRRFNQASGKLERQPAPADGNVLLLIHGTFSNGDNFVNSLLGTPDGKAFLKDADKRYKGNVFAFDHATLSVGPLLNAMDVARAFSGSKAKVDVISHSRGGLVTRWWCEAFDPMGVCVQKAILVGSPLAGTGLAAPPRLKSAIRLLTYIGKAAGQIAGLASSAVPVLAVVEALLQVLTTMTEWTAKTPLIDAAVAMIPGLFAQSRVGNNPELLRLLQTPPTIPDRYFGVLSNFEPDDPLWAFWRFFRADRLANAGADLVFEGKNDLVVDTSSMTQLTDKIVIPKKQLFDFGDSNRVHHLNYFDEIDTLNFLRGVLKI